MTRQCASCDRVFFDGTGWRHVYKRIDDCITHGYCPRCASEQRGNFGQNLSPLNRVSGGVDVRGVIKWEYDNEGHVEIMDIFIDDLDEVVDTHEKQKKYYIRRLWEEASEIAWEIEETEKMELRYGKHETQEWV